MGKRGPQPTNIEGLLRWERDWTYAFRILRDGIPGDRREVGRIAHQRSPIERVAAGLPPFEPVIWETKDLAKVVARTDIWNGLIQARSVAEVRSACRRWKSNLREVTTNQRRQTALSGFHALEIFPNLLDKHAQKFLDTIRDKRFPRAAYSDEPRLKHLARGIAGAIFGLQPATAIDRLRKMKHGPAGPLWDPESKRCMCWHCTPVRHFADLVFGGGEK
jgi:hypothetical protein